MRDAYVDGAIIEVDGAKMLAAFYGATRQRPCPTVILLHGVPGVEKNIDIAYELRERGWNCLILFHRGSWGSGGTYSFTGLAADVRAATDWLLAQDVVDGERLALAGMSMGGYMTLVAGAADDRFKALVPICPLIDPATVETSAAMFDPYTAMLQGVTGAALHKEWANLVSVYDLKDQLANRPILLVTGDRDDVFPPAHYAYIGQTMPHILHRRLADGDHAFNACRKLLVATVVDWLVEQLGR